MKKIILFFVLFSTLTVYSQNTNNVKEKAQSAQEDFDITESFSTDTLHVNLHPKEMKDLSPSRRDNIVLVTADKGKLNIPYASCYELCDNIQYLNIKNTKTVVLGYYDRYDCFIINIAEDSIYLTDARQMVKKFLIGYTKKTAFRDIYEIIKKEKEGNKEAHLIMSQIRNDNYKRISKYCPIDCVAFNPYTGASIIKHSASTYITPILVNSIEIYINKATNGKYTSYTIQKDSAMMDLLREKFLKQLNKITGYK